MPSKRTLYEAYYRDIVRREQDVEKDIGFHIGLLLTKSPNMGTFNGKFMNIYEYEVERLKRRLRRLQRLRVKAVGRLF